MNWDRIEGNWKQFKGNVKQQWGKLTDDQLDVIAGKRDHLAGIKTPKSRSHFLPTIFLPYTFASYL